MADASSAEQVPDYRTDTKEVEIKTEYECAR